MRAISLYKSQGRDSAGGAERIGENPMKKRNGTHLELARDDQGRASELKEAVESQYGGKAKFVQSVPVREMFGGQAISNTPVSVFDLHGSASGAFRAYAWAQETPEGEQTFFSVLHSPWVVGPIQAVRAVIAAEAISQK